MTRPHGIACLTGQTAAPLYRTGREHRIFGVTGHAVRPERIATRSGRDRIPALAPGRIIKISSALVLQTSPATLTPEDMSA